MSDHEVPDISVWMAFIRMCDNTVCSFLSVTQSHGSQPHVNLHAPFCNHHLFREGTRRTMTALFKCHLLNLEVRRVIMWSDMSQRCIGCLAESRPITQHYVAMTKQEAETSDPLQSRYAHPPASKLTIQCHWEITAPVRFSWLQIIQQECSKTPSGCMLK